MLSLISMYISHVISNDLWIQRQREYIQDSLNFVWLLGFEPRSPRPQRGILTTKLNYNHKILTILNIDSSTISYTWLCLREGFEATTQNFNNKNVNSRIPKVNNLTIRISKICDQHIMFSLVWIYEFHVNSKQFLIYLQGEQYIYNILNFMWFVGFEPRSQQAQRRILTTTLQPRYLNNNNGRYRYKF